MERKTAVIVLTLKNKISEYGNIKVGGQFDMVYNCKRIKGVITKIKENKIWLDVESVE